MYSLIFMAQINITELRKHLPQYLKRVGKGETLQITSRGKVVARIIPEEDQRTAALNRLKIIRGSTIKGDILSPVTDEIWSADENNL